LIWQRQLTFRDNSEAETNKLMRKPTDWVVIRLFAAIPAGLSLIAAGVCAVVITLDWVNLTNWFYDLLTACILACILIRIIRVRRRRKRYSPKWAKLTGRQRLNILAAIPTSIAVFAASMCLVTDLVSSWALGPYFLATFALVGLFFAGVVFGGVVDGRVRKGE
jgi:hypothetical protein